MLADAAILVQGRQAADDHMVADGDMAGERRIVGHRHIVAHHAIMGDMHPDHEIPVVADPGRDTGLVGAAVHRHIFAQDIVAADVEARGFPLEPAVLRRLPQGNERMHHGAGADARLARHDHMGVQDDARLDRHLVVNAAIGTDLRIVGNYRTARHDGGAMDAAHVSSRTMAAKSASATTLPATLATPSNFHTGPRLRSFLTSMINWSPG